MRWETIQGPCWLCTKYPNWTEEWSSYTNHKIFNFVPIGFSKAFYFQLHIFVLLSDTRPSGFAEGMLTTLVWFLWRQEANKSRNDQLIMHYF